MLHHRKIEWLEDRSLAHVNTGSMHDYDLQNRSSVSTKMDVQLFSTLSNSLKYSDISHIQPVKETAC